MAQIFVSHSSADNPLALRVRECLGEHVFTKFVENKRIEWDQFRIQVTKYEVERYMPMI